MDTYTYYTLTKGFSLNHCLNGTQSKPGESDAAKALRISKSRGDTVTFNAVLTACPQPGTQQGAYDYLQYKSRESITKNLHIIEGKFYDCTRGNNGWSCANASTAEFGCNVYGPYKEPLGPGGAIVNAFQMYHIDFS